MIPHLSEKGYILYHALDNDLGLLYIPHSADVGRFFYLL